MQSHCTSVTISSKELVPRSLRARPPSSQPPQAVEDIDMEDDAPSGLTGENVGCVDSDTDEEDEWDGEWEEDSTLSESEGEVLLEEDEDEVVPAFFSLSPATQSSDDDDISATSSPPPESPVHMPENGALDSKIVYGSNSKYTSQKSIRDLF
jgi:hypothetical protein